MFSLFHLAGPPPSPTLLSVPFSSFPSVSDSCLCFAELLKYLNLSLQSGFLTSSRIIFFFSFPVSFSPFFLRDKGFSRVFPLTGVVVFGAVTQLLFIPHDELWQGETVGHLHRTVLQPLKDQVIHGVANWRQRARQMRLEQRPCQKDKT